jgi:hypothetical protein
MTTKTKPTNVANEDTANAVKTQPNPSNQAVPLVLADRALTSLRASGHDYKSAVGEVFDNSLQANANKIKLRLFTEKKVLGKNTKKTEVVERVAMGDDGIGMSKEVLHRSLMLGYSSRYDDRTGMGRFGVGAKLGGISQGRRIELYSRQSANEPWLYTYIDLGEIHNGTMNYIPEPSPSQLPDDCADLVGTEHGTLVIWSKTDRLAERDSGGARQATTVESELMNYTARTFRKFLDGGIEILINGKRVRPHDPLFLMTTTRFHEGQNPDPVATVLVEESFPWEVPGHPDRTGKVEVTMTLLPEKFRPYSGSGREQLAKERRIDENEGISILRADREIFYGILSGVQPSTEKVSIDRWIGIEIRFTPELDECFQVRNVKKGAEPINGLRDKLKDIIYKTVNTARKQIQSFWDVQDTAQQAERGVHGEAEDIAANTKDISPKPVAGQDTPEPEREQKIREAAEALTKNEPGKRDEVAKKISNRPVTIVPQNFPGNELFEIEHLGSTALVKLNMRHPFYREVYSKLLTEVERASAAGENNENGSIARLAQVGLDLLILGYARAEGMRKDADEHYGDLRTYWGVHLKNMIQEWKKS